MSAELTLALIDAAVATIAANAEELTRLDQAIGDGDHGSNMQRGFEAILGQREALGALAPGEALQKAGMTLVTTVGGASGPLYGSLLMAVGKAVQAGKSWPQACAEGVEAVKRRGKSDVGAKTMLDVLVPVVDALAAGKTTAELRDLGDGQPRGDEGDAGDAGPGLVPGRALARALRPGCDLDPAPRPRRLRRAGATSMSAIVGIAIVSHSSKVAEGAGDMVRQMVGTEVPCAWTGGDPAGGLGTDALAIKAAIESVWSEAGVAVFVDLGGAEMNAEMAIEMLGEERGRRVRICNAPVVEGAVVAATEAAGAASLEAVCAAAEELSP